MNRKFDCVGIDLGTTYSVIAYVDLHDEARVVQNPDDQRPILPTAVFFDGEEVIVGENALSHAHVYPKQVVQFAKRSIGESNSYQVGKHEHSPETISALVLKKLMAYAEPSIGEIKKAVITVPAFFNEKRRAATEQCGTIAGLEVMGTLNEPSAALIAYGLHTSNEEKHYAVYDLGGGTFDVTVMRVGNHKIQELATGGNRELGGIDWDRALVDHVAEEFVKACGADPRDDAISYQTLFTDCRQAKQRLSELQRTAVQCVHAGKAHRVEMTREKYEKLTRSLVTKTEMTVEACIHDAGLSWEKLEAVLLVGGSTRMPMIRNMLQRTSGKPVLTNVDPDLAVAIGAARYAGVLESAGSISGAAQPSNAPADQTPAPEPVAVPTELPDLDDDEDDLEVMLNLVNPHGIGVFAREGDKRVNVVMIPKNSELPIQQTKMFRTVKKVSRIRITVTEGDTEHRESCEVLGVCVLGPLPKSLPVGGPVELSIGYGKDGRVQVAAVCKTTNTQVQAEMQREGILTAEEVDQEARKFADISVT